MALLVAAGGSAWAADDDASSLANALGRDSEVTLHLRTYYFDRLNPTPPDNAAWAIGGWLGYRSGWIGDALRFGLVGYTSQPLWAPSDKSGSGLLTSDQQGYSALGEAYVSLKLWDQVLTGGRFGVNQPEINASDNRMTPITYAGGSLAGTLAGIEYYGAYLSTTKPKTSEDFIDFVQAAGITSTASEPMWLAGFSASPLKDLKLRLSSYYVSNVISSTYADATWSTPIDDGVTLRLGGQAMYQTSVGDKLLTGSAFSTNSIGLKLDYLSGPTILTLAYQQTGRGSKYQTPYSSWAGYTSMIVKDFDQAGQKALLIGATYDFAELNVPGFVLNGAVVFDADAIAPSAGAPPPTWTEYDLTADYRFSAASWPEWARPLWLRGRAAHVSQGSAGTINDYRIILNYEWVFK
jgi:outer membrane porin, OprD family